MRGTTVPLVELYENTDPNVASLEGTWHSDELPLTKKNQREDVPLRIDFAALGTLRTTLQAKVYSEGDAGHSRWGNRLSYVDFELAYDDSKMSLDLIKQSFR